MSTAAVGSVLVASAPGIDSSPSIEDPLAKFRTRMQTSPPLGASNYPAPPPPFGSPNGSGGLGSSLAQQSSPTAASSKQPATYTAGSYAAAVMANNAKKGAAPLPTATAAAAGATAGAGHEAYSSPPSRRSDTDVFHANDVPMKTPERSMTDSPSMAPRVDLDDEADEESKQRILRLLDEVVGSISGADSGAGSHHHHHHHDDDDFFGSSQQQQQQQQHGLGIGGGYGGPFSTVSPAYRGGGGGGGNAGRFQGPLGNGSFAALAAPPVSPAGGTMMVGPSSASRSPVMAGAGLGTPIMGPGGYALPPPQMTGSFGLPPASMQQLPPPPAYGRQHLPVKPGLKGDAPPYHLAAHGGSPAPSFVQAAASADIAGVSGTSPTLSGIGVATDPITAAFQRPLPPPPPRSPPSFAATVAGGALSTPPIGPMPPSAEHPALPAMAKDSLGAPMCAGGAQQQQQSPPPAGEVLIVRNSNGVFLLHPTGQFVPKTPMLGGGNSNTPPPPPPASPLQHGASVGGSPLPGSFALPPPPPPPPMSGPPPMRPPAYGNHHQPHHHHHNGPPPPWAPMRRDGGVGTSPVIDAHHPGHHHGNGAVPPYALPPPIGGPGHVAARMGGPLPPPPPYSPIVGGAAAPFHADSPSGFHLPS